VSFYYMLEKTHYKPIQFKTKAQQSKKCPFHHYNK